MSIPDEHGSKPDCVTCGHPGSHHDAGECWTDARGREVSSGSFCDCHWYTPRHAVEGTP
jgi:hypothetical protein